MSRPSTNGAPDEASGNFVAATFSDSVTRAVDGGFAGCAVTANKAGETWQVRLGDETTVDFKLERDWLVAEVGLPTKVNDVSLAGGRVGQLVPFSIVCDTAGNKRLRAARPTDGSRELSAWIADVIEAAATSSAENPATFFAAAPSADSPSGPAPASTATNAADAPPLVGDLCAQLGLEARIVDDETAIVLPSVEAGAVPAMQVRRGGKFILVRAAITLPAMDEVCSRALGEHSLRVAASQFALRCGFDVVDGADSMIFEAVTDDVSAEGIAFGLDCVETALGLHGDATRALAASSDLAAAYLQVVAPSGALRTDETGGETGGETETTETRAIFAAMEAMSAP